MREKGIRERLAAIEKRLDELAEAVLELAKSALELAKSDLEILRLHAESVKDDIDHLHYLAAKEEEGDEFVDRLAKQQAMMQVTVDKAEAVVKALEPNQKKKEEDLAKLTRREGEVYLLLTQGKQSKEIAAELNISVSTANLHAGNIKRKLGVKNRAHFIPPPVTLS